MENENKVEFEVYEHPDVKKRWVAYYIWLSLNFEKILEQSSVTIDQFDDLYAGFFGVLGNFGSGKTPERIDELSPMPVVKNEKELKNREDSLVFSILSVMMTENEASYESFGESIGDVDEYIKVNYTEGVKSEFPTPMEIREMLMKKFEKKHEV